MTDRTSIRAILAGFSDDDAEAARARLESAGFPTSSGRFPPETPSPGRDIVVFDLRAIGTAGFPDSAASLREACGAPVLAVYDEPLPDEKTLETCAIFPRVPGFAGIEAAFMSLASRERECEKFRNAYANSLNGICTHRMLYADDGAARDCEYLEVNDAFALVTGISRERAIGKTIRDLFPAEDAAGIIALYDEALKTNAPARREIFFNPTGGWYNLSITRICGADFTVFVENISDRKKSALALDRAEWHFRSIVDSGLALIWTSDVTGKCDYFNKPWLKFTGRKLEEELGDGWTEGVHPEDYERCVSTYRNAFAAREVFRMEYRIRSASGEYRWLEDLGVPRRDESGTFVGYVGHCIDVNAKKTAEQTVGEKIDELERFRKLTIDREIRMIELKREVNELLRLSGVPERYAADYGDGGAKGSDA